MTARDRAVGDVMPRQVTPIPKQVPPDKKRKPFPRWRDGRKSAEWNRTRKWVMARAGDRCEVRTDGCWKRATQVHHIQRRSQGGSDDPSNLLAACDFCHDWIHRNVSLAKAAGWLA